MRALLNRNHLVFATVLFAATAVSSVVRAEGFVDLRVGGAFTSDNRIKASLLGISVRGTDTFKNSVTGGVRGGYWFDSLPWLGVAADVSLFAPDEHGGDAEFDVIPVSPLLMARVPIAKDETYPNGRIQPFLGIGPGIFLSTIHVTSVGYNADSADVGADLHVGIKYMVTPSIGLFAEYRFTSFEAKYSDTLPPGVRVNVDSQFDTHHIAAGVGFHF